MLFSDIEGSTTLLSRLGVAYADALDVQRSVLRAAWSGCGGVEMGTEGDSFFVVFDSARDALEAAARAQRGLASQRWPEGEQVRVRMGIHTGEPLQHGDGYVGMDVHRAARVAAAAHGGQILLTASTRGLAGSSPPVGTSLTDLGWHRFKDLPEPLRVWQLSGEGLLDSFAAIRSMGTSSSLPVESTPLIGREGDLVALADRLNQGARLVTLTGTGGSGKTRLAIASAADRAETTPDGVFFVPMAEVTAGAEMWAAIASALSLPGEGEARRRVTAQLSDSNVLLILDNLEQIPDAAEVVLDLLTALPRLVLIATSRRVLHVVGEHQHVVEPLALPADDSLAAAQVSDAAQMFCRHASMAGSQFVLTSDNASSVADICRRVDGLPLAIELAAARVRFLSPAAVLAGLASSLDLHAPAAGRPGRQQALRDTIEWSHDLLRPDLQDMLHALGVFAGGADLPAVAAVAPPPVSGDHLDGLIELADASFVNVIEDPDGTPRFALLQVVAEFSEERLAQSGDLDAARTRHAEHFVRLADALTAQLNSGRQAEILAKLDLERDNLRAVLRWTLDSDDGAPPPERAQLGLRLSSSMWDLWAVWRKEDVPESIHWYQRALSVAPKADSPERATALVALSLLLADMGEQQLADDRASAALAIGRRLHDARSTCLALFALAKRDAVEGSDRALPLLQEVERVAGDDALAIAIGWTARIWYETAAGHFDKALEYGRRCVDLAASKGDENSLTWTNLFIAEVLLRKGSTDQALEQLRNCTRAAFRLGNRNMMIEVLALAAMIAAAHGEAVRAAELVGTNWALVRQTGGLILDDEEEKWLLETGLALMRDRLGSAAWNAAVARGERLTVQEALAFDDSAIPRPAGDASDR